MREIDLNNYILHITNSYLLCAIGKCTYHKILQPEMSCIICKRRQDKKAGVSFHCIPRNDVRRKVWLEACNLKPRNITERTRICGIHFTADSFLPHREYGLPLLKQTAVPTLNLKRYLKGFQLIKIVPNGTSTCILQNNDNGFNDVSTVKSAVLEPAVSQDTVSNKIPNIALENSIKKNESFISMQDESPANFAPLENTPKKRKVWCPARVEDYSDFSTLRRSRVAFKIATRKIREYKCKINALRRKHKKLQDRVKTLKHLVNHLENRNMFCTQTAYSLLVWIERVLVINRKSKVNVS